MASANGSSGQALGVRHPRGKGQSSTAAPTGTKAAATATGMVIPANAILSDAQTAAPAAPVTTTPPLAMPTLPLWIGSIPNAQGMAPEAGVVAEGDETEGEGEASALLKTGTTLQMGGLSLAGKGRAKGQTGLTAELSTPAAQGMTAAADTKAKDSVGEGLLDAPAATADGTENKAENSRAGTPTSTVAYPGEKIAAIGGRSQFSGENSKSFGDKNAQDNDPKLLVSSPASLGTTVAKSDAVMSSDLRQHTVVDPTPSLDSTLLARSVSATASTSGPAHVFQPSVSETFSTPSTAEGAVQTVMHVVDLQASTAQSTAASVNLHFKIGDSNLAVRVEMQAGVVHTQFSTDSSDLRNAIKTEWQSAVSDTVSNKAVHFSDPVFSSQGDSPSSNGSSWNERGNPQSRYASPDDLASLTSGFSQNSPSEIEMVTGASAPAASPLSNRLLTFA